MTQERLAGRIPYPVFPSFAVPLGTVAVVALPALAFVVDPVPIIDVSSEAVLHMENETPAQIVNGAGTAAAPVRSMYQTDAIAIRLIANIT